MRKIEDVLRLHAQGFSTRRMSLATGVGKTTVIEYLRRAAMAGVSWPPPDEARVRQLLEWGQRAENGNDKDRAISLYHQALAGCRQMQRGPSLGQRLKALLNKAPAAPPDPLLEECKERLARAENIGVAQSLTISQSGDELMLAGSDNISQLQLAESLNEQALGLYRQNTTEQQQEPPISARDFCTLQAVDTHGRASRAKFLISARIDAASRPGEMIRRRYAIGSLPCLSRMFRLF